LPMVFFDAALPAAYIFAPRRFPIIADPVHLAGCMC
jgi:hypothetical protein